MIVRKRAPFRAFLETFIILTICLICGIVGATVLDRAQWESQKDPAPTIAMENTIKPGSGAPDFSLRNVATNQPTGLRRPGNNKPVVLIFGSFGCDIFCSQLGQLKQLYRDYHDKAEFILIFVREQGHTIPELEQAYAQAGIGKKTPENQRERIRLGIKAFGLPFPSLIDDSQQVGMHYLLPIMGVAIVGANGKIEMRSTLHDGWYKSANRWLEHFQVKPSV